MPRIDDADEYGPDDELPDESDLDPSDDDSSEATEECPYCEAEIYGDSEWCPQCGKYLSDEDAPPQRTNWFLIAVVVLMLVITLLTLMY